MDQFESVAIHTRNTNLQVDNNMESPHCFDSNMPNTLLDYNWPMPHPPDRYVLYHKSPDNNLLEGLQQPGFHTG